MKKIVCGEENAKAFNAELRERAPAFHALARELYQSGLISGLAGATLTIHPADYEFPRDEPFVADTRVCRGCRHWGADTVGDGTGIGQCAVGGWPDKLKWPNQNACRLWEQGK